MINKLKSLSIAFSMYSKIPVPIVDWTEEAMRYALCFFPLVGLVQGVVYYLWSYFGIRIFGPSNLLYAAVLTVLPVLITGGIHLDGLLDTADALSSYKPMEEKLRILKDTHAGAFAIIICCCYFTLSLGACTMVVPQSAKVIAIGFIFSRSLSGFGIVTFKNARGSGLAATFADMAVKKTVRIVMILSALISGAAMIWVYPVCGACSLAAALLVLLWYKRLVFKQFGGITGDTCGFFVQITELVITITAVTAHQIIGMI